MLQKITSFDQIRNLRGGVIFDYCAGTRITYQLVDLMENNLKLICHRKGSGLRILPIEHIIAGNWFIEVGRKVVN